MKKNLKTRTNLSKSVSLYENTEKWAFGLCLSFSPWLWVFSLSFEFFLEFWVLLKKQIQYLLSARSELWVFSNTFDTVFSATWLSNRTNPNGCPIKATFYVSHEWTDYTMVHDLYRAGHEIASHTITHSDGSWFDEGRWASGMETRHLKFPPCTEVHEFYGKNRRR